MCLLKSDCEIVRVAVYKAVYSALYKKEAPPTKRFLQTLEANKSLICCLVESISRPDSAYCVIWGLISILAILLSSKNVQNYIIFETPFFDTLKSLLSGSAMSLELHYYLIENIKSLCNSEQFQEKVAKSFAQTLLESLFQGRSRFVSQNFQKVLVSYSEVIFLLRETNYLGLLIRREAVFAQLALCFLGPNTNEAMQKWFLQVIHFFIEKQVSFIPFLDSKYVLFESGLFCLATERAQVELLLSESAETDKVVRSFRLCQLFLETLERAVEREENKIIQLILLLFCHFSASRTLKNFLKQKQDLLHSLSEEFPATIAELFTVANS